jgi:uncharacterized RDD family membrane protein YckC
MFIIIGGDSREYGPATTEQVRSWLNAGRANLDTKAKALGSDEWRRLGDFAEFGDPAAPPPLVDGVPALPVGSIEAVSMADQAELAGTGLRTVAACFNALIYFLSIVPGMMVMSRILLENFPQLAEGGMPNLEDLDLAALAGGVAWVWAGLLSAFFVQAVLIAWRGQNLGKLLVGIRVVRIDTGAPAGFLRGVVLRFGLPVSLVIVLNGVFMLGFVFLLVDYAFMFRDDRRCLHDLIAGTKVVRN